MAKKLVLLIGIIVVVLLILPYCVVSFTDAWSGMGVMLLLLFLVNPAAAGGIGVVVGKDIKKLWWAPLAFAVVFVLCYWLVLSSVVLEFCMYAMAYWLIGSVVMLICALASGAKRPKSQ